MNDLIKDAVWAARLPDAGQYSASVETTDAACAKLEEDIAGWALTPAVEALGKLISIFTDRFGKTVLTSNFDPLIQVSIKRAGGQSFSTILHGDGPTGITRGPGCHIVHLHGYWYGADTLHTPLQLNQPRPRLKAHLANLLKGKTIVTVGYGGWEDIFAQALTECFADTAANPDLVWTFFDRTTRPSPTLLTRLEAGLYRGRVTFYGGIDCNRFFPSLLEAWEKTEPKNLPLLHSAREVESTIAPRATNKFRLTETERLRVANSPEFGCDRPPYIEAWVGREVEMGMLLSTDCPVVVMTGIGGQGKSALAASYVKEVAETRNRFDLWDWRDCKEESERFRNHIVNVIGRLSGNYLKPNELTELSTKELAETLLYQLEGLRCLFVFDNVDHYLNLASLTFIGDIQVLISTILECRPSSRFVFTCRPSIESDSPGVLVLPLGGLGLPETKQLFKKRRALDAQNTEIEEAHSLTNGHAFWLDLLAVQAGRGFPGVNLARLVKDIREGHPELPESTLASIWGTLADRDKIVLRAMAETVRSETESQIREYLSGKLSTHKTNRALKSLRALNLLVVKPRKNSPDLLELHPVIREFMRKRFGREERALYIEMIIPVYVREIGLHKRVLVKDPPFNILQLWTQKAELDTAVGKYQEAFNSLKEVQDAFSSSVYTEEFIRVARKLFGSFEWRDAHVTYAHFDDVLSCVSKILDDLGRWDEADSLLDDYSATVPAMDVRFINYCNLRCHSYWVRGEFDKAILWGERGQDLKQQSGVDTNFDCGHHLALARRDSRDSKNIEIALEYFLKGHPIEEVTDPTKTDEDLGGVYYGNIGRCLHFKGDIEGALSCYRKSALLLERRNPVYRALNQGFIRSWIGEALALQANFELAYVFFAAANEKWSKISPLRARGLDTNIAGVIQRGTLQVPNHLQDVEARCIDWIHAAT